MFKFIIYLFFSLLIILSLIFSFNMYVDVLNIFGKKNIENIYLGTKIAGEREKLLSPILFKDFSYSKVIIGTSKAKFVCDDKNIGNFGLSGLKIEEINDYILLIKKYNKKEIKKIYLFIDLEQFISEDTNVKYKIEDNKPKYLLKYFSFLYFIESKEQIRLNNSLTVFNPYINKEEIFSQKKIHIKKYEDIRKEIYLNLLNKNKKTLIKELNQLDKNKIIVIINPSRQYIINKITKKEIINIETEIKRNTGLKVFNYYNFENKESNFVDSLHFHQGLGNKIWNEVLKNEK